MNYYNQWWEKARNSTGILTKPEEKKLLLKRIKDLEELMAQGKKSQVYLILQQAKANYRKQAKDLQKDLEDLQADYHTLENKEQLITYQRDSLERECQALKTEKQKLTDLANAQIRGLEKERDRISRSFTHGSAAGNTHWIYYKNIADQAELKHQQSKKDLGQLLTKAKRYLAELEQTRAELLATKELLSIYQATDALSFFNTEPESVSRVLGQHPTKLYYLFYSTDSQRELDLAPLETKLEDSCLFWGTFGQGALEVNLNREQAEVISLRTPRKVEELFQFSKQKLFITEATKLYKEGELLIPAKGKGKGTDTPSASQPGFSPSPTVTGEETKAKKSKRERFGLGKKDKDK